MTLRECKRSAEQQEGQIHALLRGPRNGTVGDCLCRGGRAGPQKEAVQSGWELNLRLPTRNTGELPLSEARGKVNS